MSSASITQATFMKLLSIATIAAMFVSTTSCRVGRGCPTNGKNVGAERILSGEAKAIKDARKAGKFRS